MGCFVPAGIYLLIINISVWDLIRVSIVKQDRVCVLLIYND